MYSLYGVENPLMDVIAHVDYPFLQRFGKTPGPCTWSSTRKYRGSWRRSAPAHLARGSAANTARGMAWLSSVEGKALPSQCSDGPCVRQSRRRRRLHGAIGRDRRGDEFAAQIAGAGVRPALVRKDTPTGTSVILVTPDGERTMNTFLGACRDFQVQDLALADLSQSRMLYLTGYLWEPTTSARLPNGCAFRPRGESVDHHRL